MIRKNPLATGIDNLRPISLCNVLNKIMSKLLNSRLRSLLPQIISQEQSGFISGRDIQGNIALASDLVSDIHKKRFGGNILLKIDMSKAYDRLSWGFVIQVLRWHGFSHSWCNLIYHTISNCWYSILWGGRSFGFFKSSRGVRQGDPLSPSIFILAMNYLSHLINSDVRAGRTVPFGVGNLDSSVHHLMYADDLLIFANGGKRSFSMLLKSLKDFCNLAGQQINQDKSRIFFSKRIVGARKRLLCQCSGFVEGLFPTKYLGAPLFPGRAKISYFKEYEDIIFKRINSWSKSFLSLGGRITLIQAVLNSLTVHVMSSLPIPKTCVSRMQRIIRNFLWDYGGASRRHWIGWKTVCLPKQDGGLGLSSLWDIRRCCLSKLAWSFLNNRSLWSRHASERFKLGKVGSGIWQSVSPLIRRLIKESYWDIGDGDINLKHFCLWLEVEAPIELQSDSVAEVVSNRTKLDLLLNHLPPVMHGLFSNLQFANAKRVLLWRKSSNGSFSAKSFHGSGHSDNPSMKWFQSLWCLWIPTRIAAFAWKAFHRRVATDENIKKCGIPFPSKCWCCVNAQEETSDHLFFTGETAARLWSFAAKIFGRPVPKSLSHCLRSWFVLPHRKVFLDNLRVGVAACVLWEIWKHRNQLRNEGSTRQGVAEIKNWAFRMCPLVQGISDNSLGSRLSLQLLEVPPPSSMTSKGFWAAWCPFHSGLTLSVAVNPSPSGLFFGGVLRDHKGAFVLAFRLLITSDCLYTGILRTIGSLNLISVAPSRIQSSHKFLFSLINPEILPPSSSRASWKECLALRPDISFEVIHESHNSPASILSFHGTLGFSRSSRMIPRAAQIALAGDKFPRFFG